ncbi:hypothetical protein DPMN_061895 [Dreissena polymorpha]|uniref:Uncharacterized protein n=1 Tax=Dreissena polymorpha TaxID=45954 RepID=A0A9D4C7U4_DREPO|nr:hypothetical protein DPMN_061895 [Dreissena polymorpha]
MFSNPPLEISMEINSMLTNSKGEDEQMFTKTVARCGPDYAGFNGGIHTHTV